jgi:hypothetical protein
MGFYKKKKKFLVNALLILFTGTLLSLKRTGRR